MGDRNNFLEYLPEVGWSITSNKSIVLVCNLGLIKRLALSNHHEKDNSHSKEIGFFSAVWLVSMELW
jgi:hypothetical protein